MTTDILQRLRAGDEGALATLLDGEWAGLVRFLQRRLESSDAAQDAAQEAFVRLWERREQWQAGSARALLFRIGANIAADVERRSNVRRRWQRQAPGAGRPPPPTPEEELDGSEARVRFLEALARLAPKRREVFRLVRDEGLGYREVAEVLELSPQTVANHMSLALRELRAELSDLLPDRRQRNTPDEERSRDG